MKRLILTLLASFALLPCCTSITDEMNKSNQALEERIKENADKIAALEKRCEELNFNLDALRKTVQALQDNDFIKSVTPLYDKDGITVIGYNISFVKSGEIRVFAGENGKDGEDGKPGDPGNDGNDGHSPVVGIAKGADGVYYWTLDGEWLTDSDGQRIKAEGKNGVTPQFRITDDYWEISYNGGKDWASLGKATGDTGKSFFENVSDFEDKVTLTLADGSVITIPKYKKPVIKFSIEDNETGAVSGIDVIVGYQISNASEGTVVSVSSDGNYAAKIVKDSPLSGKLTITPPTPYTDGFVNVTLTDDYGYSQVEVINFHQNLISFAEGPEYQIPPEGGLVEIPYSLNFDHEVRTTSDWLKITPTTRAEMREKSIKVSAEKNELFRSRQAVIGIYAKTNPNQPYAEIIINQSSAYFTLSQSNFAVSDAGGAISAKITSSLGLSVSVEDSVDWVTCSLSGPKGNDYVLTASVSRNTTAVKRFAKIILFDQSQSKELGTVVIVQQSGLSDSIEDMVFTVRANYPNDFTSVLPLSGTIDCYVDWGDGYVEYYKSGPVSHKYNVEEPHSFKVIVSGTVTELKSNEETIPSIIEVNQWGKTGLKDMWGAFQNNTILQYIAGNAANSFALVRSFQEAFANCINLKNIPANLFKGCFEASTFGSTFSGCSSITEIPSKLFFDCNRATMFGGVFKNCISLSTIPGDIFSNCRNMTRISYGFANCQSLKSVPESLFADCPNIENASRLFEECNHLVAVPTGIFDNNRNLTNLNGTFSECYSLKGESPYTIISGRKYHLYERNDAPDYFSPVINMKGLFYWTYENLDDKDSIPDVCRMGPNS